MNTTVKTPVYHFATFASCCVLLVYRKQEHGIFKMYISFFPRFKFGLTGRGVRLGLIFHNYIVFILLVFVHLFSLLRFNNMKSGAYMLLKVLCQCIFYV